jgi:hypothetical protein
LHRWPLSRIGGLNARYGSAIPYAQAFLATDLLIEQRGVSSVIDYFDVCPMLQTSSRIFRQRSA